MSYGADSSESFERTERAGGLHLQWGRPQDVPFELPTRYALAIDLKTAKATGLKFRPPCWQLPTGSLNSLVRCTERQAPAFLLGLGE